MGEKVLKILSFIKSYSNNFNFKAYGLIALTAIIYATLLNNLNLWTDEIYSVLMAKDRFSDMWNLLTTEDSKPPLYYLYLKFVLALFPQKYEIFGAHFASYILLILAQVFCATSLKRDFGDKIALLMIALIFLMPHSLWLAFEVRTYMLSNLLLLMALVFGIRLLNSPFSSDFFKFSLVSLLALYSHYYCAVFLFFLYLYLLVAILFSRKNDILIKFLLSTVCVSLLFLPWLAIPLTTAQNISRDWYVTWDFVKFSPQFFINPLAPDMWQSFLFIFEILAVAPLTFIVISALFNLKKFKEISADNSRLLSLSCFSLFASYICLILLSLYIRPLVTARYLLSFSLPLFLAGAIALSYFKNLQKSFIFIALIAFGAAFTDVRKASFDLGFSRLTQDIRQFVSPNQPILTFDNNNLFCEYYLPEYTCLAVVNETGEILRLPSILKNIHHYSAPLPEISFALSSYEQLRHNFECVTYNSGYRLNFGTDLCKLNAQNAGNFLKNSLNLRLNNY